MAITSPSTFSTPAPKAVVFLRGGYTRAKYTPLYWATVKRAFASPFHSISSHIRPVPASDDSLGQRTLFDSLISYPFSEESCADAHQACLLTSSHDTFVQLCRHDPSRTEVLPWLDAHDAEDGRTSWPRINVVEVSNGDGQSSPKENAMSWAFFTIRAFQRRVCSWWHPDRIHCTRSHVVSLLSQSLAYQVILGRSTASGTWIVHLDLVHSSPPTWVDSWLTITVPTPSETQPTVSTKPFSFSSVSTMNNSPDKHRPTPIVLRFRNPGNSQLSGELKDKCKIAPEVQ